MHRLSAIWGALRGITIRSPVYAERAELFGRTAYGASVSPVIGPFNRFSMPMV